MRIYKIACIIHSLGIGGMERVMAILLNHFAAKSQVELHCILIGRKRETLQSIDESIVIHRPAWEFDNQKRTLHTFKTIGFIRSTVKSIQPDTILSFGELWNNLVLIALLGSRIPVYIADRSQPNKNLGIVQNALREILYRTATGFIAQTEKAELIARKKNWNDNRKIIGNPIPPMLGNPEDKSKIVLTVGRLIKTKNVDFLIKAFHQVDALSWSMKIVGGNAKNLNLLEDYQQLVEELQLGNTVNLMGEQQNVAIHFQEAAIFAFASSSEGFPNALGEAMAAGCACIAYDCVAGPSDIIDDGINGFLVPLGEEEQYIKKLRWLMEDEALRIRFGKAAQEKMKQFEASKIAEKFYQFITQEL
ncbi:MAG: glycosyltransferase [Cyclobacteriaceae bacterium]|nr:glycosyltransferase [Cyclobacteriaceae bacterium]MCH8516915.1 glycosyltransferase [Cyclobacteriaceae bacterium]